MGTWDNFQVGILAIGPKSVAVIKSIIVLVILNLENLDFTLLETHKASAVGAGLVTLGFLRVRLAAILRKILEVEKSSASWKVEELFVLDEVLFEKYFKVHIF